MPINLELKHELMGALEGDRQPQIQEWLGDLSSRIAECGTAMDNLDIRLQSTKNPTIPKTVSDSPDPPLEELAPIADTLRSYCYQVSLITRCIERQLEELEL